MTAISPHYQSMKFPPYEHREYPKMLHKPVLDGGKASLTNFTVKDKDEEAKAKELGWLDHDDASKALSKLAAQLSSDADAAEADELERRAVELRAKSAPKKPAKAPKAADA